MVMNFIGNLVGGLFGRSSANSVNANLAKQYSYDKLLAEQGYNYSRALNEQLAMINTGLTRQNYELQRESRQTSFVDTRKDLESAGYNPLLALGVQSNSLNPAVTQSGNTFNMPDSNSVFSAVSTAGNIAKIKSDIDSSKYVNDLNLAYAEKARSETRGQDINNVIQDRTGLTRSLEEINNLRQQGLLSKSQARYYQKQLAVADSNISLNSANALVARSQDVLNKQQSELNAPDVRFARKHPVAHATLRRIGSPVSAIGSLAGIKYMMSVPRKE